MKNNEISHQDSLAFLNKNVTIKEKLVSAHEAIKESYPFIERIAVTLYDPETRVLKTYLHSSITDNPLENYQSLLDNAPSLKEILKQGNPRVINNMLTFQEGQAEHSRRIARAGYAASYTLPIFHKGDFLGFIFFNSYDKYVFEEKVLKELDLYGHLIALMILNELSAIDTLNAALITTSHITHIRDPETGSHLDRMSRYCRLIAQELADKYNLDDDYIEHVFMFAPLHDIGKIAIPDDILLKPDELDTDEMEIMKTHSRIGRDMIDDILQNFGLDSVEHVNILRNIAEYHHEAVNGTGYPEGRSSDEIPLEARIVAVADVFDALTSRRVYKDAWDIDKAFTTLKSMAGEQLDVDCVQALLDNRLIVEDIQKRFQEDFYG
jgi:HD-GYP domain-containing protein (c-di-GMP phosphodiesterase class II)